MSKFICYVCNYKTNRSDNLKRHLTSNTHLRCVDTESKYVKYTCDLCQYTSNHRNDFRKHTQTCNKESLKEFISTLENKRDKLIEKSNELYEKWSIMKEMVDHFKAQAPLTYKPPDKYIELEDEYELLYSELDLIQDKLESFQQEEKKNNSSTPETKPLKKKKKLVVMSPEEFQIKYPKLKQELEETEPKKNNVIYNIMPTVKELKKTIKDYKILNCPAYSKLKKQDLENLTTKLGLNNSSTPEPKPKVSKTKTEPKPKVSKTKTEPKPKVSKTKTEPKPKVSETKTEPKAKVSKTKTEPKLTEDEIKMNKYKEQQDSFKKKIKLQEQESYNEDKTRFKDFSIKKMESIKTKEELTDYFRDFKELRFDIRGYNRPEHNTIKLKNKEDWKEYKRTLYENDTKEGQKKIDDMIYLYNSHLNQIRKRAKNLK